MNKNTILNIIFGIVGGAVIVFMGYIIITTKIQANQNSTDIKAVADFLNNQIKQNTPAPSK